jgi:hypothetical protein
MANRIRDGPGCRDAIQVLRKNFPDLIQQLAPQHFCPLRPNTEFLASLHRSVFESTVPGRLATRSGNSWRIETFVSRGSYAPTSKQGSLLRNPEKWKPIPCCWSCVPRKAANLLWSARDRHSPIRSRYGRDSLSNAPVNQHLRRRAFVKDLAGSKHQALPDLARAEQARALQARTLY